RRTCMSSASNTDEPAHKTRIMKLGAFEMPIPGWCVPGLGAIAVLYVGFALLSEPIQTVYSRYLLGKAEEQDQLESYKHFWERPAMEVHDSGTAGSLDAKLFSDGCVSVAWQAAMSNVPPVPHFIKKLTSAELAAPHAPTPSGSGSELTHRT